MSFKALVTQNERGRSMVEILGVLAIIGVLSFGGIQGYKYAMDKHRANDIVNEVNMRATDIWHLYQDGEKELPDSPDEDAFPEYGEMTQTGFEILVTSHPPVAFRTWVNDVPSAVCQKVLQENLNDAIQGLKFVQVGDVDAENLIRYTGDTAICGESGTMNQMVFTSFLDEDGGAVPEGNGDNNAMESCVENEDCSNLCGIALCDTNTFQCDNACANGQVCKPNEDATSGTCVDCVVNTDCPVRGQICNDLTNTCVTPPDSCELGVTFRSKNGVCIPCEDASNIVIDTEVFEFSELNIKDELTGVEQCQSCQNTHYVGTNQDGTTFCSIACIKGASYQSANEGCIPCYNTDGTLNTETHDMNNSNSAAFEQCLACGLNWYKYYYISKCQPEMTCPQNQFLYTIHTNPLACAKCSINQAYTMYSFFSASSTNVPNMIQKIKDSCTSCPERDENGVWSKREIIGDSCWPVCEQPEAGSEADVNCTKENATEEEKAKCKRKWQNSNGACFDANSTTGDTYIGSNERLIDLCQKSGRTVYGGYCVIPIDDCGLGKFKASNGKCYDCTYSDYNASITVLNEEDSKCVANCHYDEATQKYTSDTSKPSKRYIYTNSSGTNYCYKTCPENQWQNSQGTCYDCNAEPGAGRYYNSVIGGYSDIGKSMCDARCPSGEFARKVYEDGRCLFLNCPTKNNVTYFKNKFGECQNCDTASGTSAYGNSRAECHRCDNRIFLQRSGYSWGGYWDDNGSTGLCVSFNPGVSGICNSIELDSIPIPSTLKPSLVSAAADYVSGKYDGLKFRASMTGNCIDCSSQTDVQTTREQCKSCPQRRFSAGANQLGTCSLGQCEENVEFLNFNYNCVKCANSYNRSASEIEVKKKYLCESCENRRIMTQNSTEKSYCVPNDCSLGFEWQTASSGSCISCTSTDSKQEIGAESVYREQCEECNRVAYSITDGTKEIWYCSRRQPDNKKYFVNIDGGLTACNTNGDVEIPNTEKAKTICSECLDVAREAYVEDGKAYCAKL